MERVVDLVVALGLSLPPLVLAFAAYKRAHASVIWAKRRDPKSH